MRVLTLDDMELRQAAFRRWFIGCDLLQVFTSQAAIDALRTKGFFDLVMLDHDLAEEHYLTFGDEKYSPGTGMDVVDFIITMPADQRPKQVVIHSQNVPRSEEMLARLIEARVRSMRLPFTSIRDGTISFK